MRNAASPQTNSSQLFEWAAAHRDLAQIGHHFVYFETRSDCEPPRDQL
jgi:hypothetical protein